MIHIKYKLDRSIIHGIGLFTQEDLKKGQVVYSASPILDINITVNEFDSLDEKEKNEIRYWGFWDKTHNEWHVDFDNSKFINHSFTPTLTQDPKHKDTYLIAARDIKSGEELTQNYLEFESKEALKKRGIQII
ncbi:MAG: SET domain-containing protein [Patescibacteria group bacterium]